MMIANSLALRRLGTFARLLVLIAWLMLTAGCQSGPADGRPDYPVTIIPPAGTLSPTPSPKPGASPTLDWGQVTLLPLKTPDTSPEPTEQPGRAVPDPLTEANPDFMAAGRPPFTLSDAEISLGRLALPVDLSRAGPFRVQSIAVENYPNWRFLAFDLPLPAAGELGPVVRAPISGQVMGGTMQMVNEQVAQTVSVDHSLGQGQLLRATLVYTGAIEPLFVMGQQVRAGEALFRLTRDTGRLDTLGSTPIPGGAVMTLHASIDSVIQQDSGVEALKFLRGVSLTPGGLLRDEEGRIISPVN